VGLSGAAWQLLAGSQCPGTQLQGNSASVLYILPYLSQNHRMVGVGRDLCGSSSPTLLPKQGHLQQAAQHLVQPSLEYLQRRRLHNLPGQPVPVLRHPQREEVLHMFRWNFLCFSFCPLPLVLSLGTTEKSLAPSS